MGDRAKRWRWARSGFGVEHYWRAPQGGGERVISWESIAAASETIIERHSGFPLPTIRLVAPTQGKPWWARRKRRGTYPPMSVAAVDAGMNTMDALAKRGAFAARQERRNVRLWWRCMVMHVARCVFHPGKSAVGRLMIGSGREWHDTIGACVACCERSKSGLPIPA